ncbi:MAG: hypothetical protein KF845_16150 [Cyclobacteriaceae bacterium]|nr:hypothetical protein [Cyclobacteriaceae bacterium]
MTILEKIRKFLQDNSEISIGYNEITFFAVDELDEEQVGYSVDDNNNSLITGQEGDWKEEWLVIGVDGLIEDPIFVDTSSKQLQVLTAAHGEGEWEPIPIADTLDSFAYIIIELKKNSVNRSTPVDLEENPISDNEKKQFLARIKKNNSYSDIDYWENFLEAD